MGERPQAIVVESDRKRRQEVNPIPQEQITFLEFASGQEWIGEGFRLKVLEQTKSGRYKVYIDNKETGVAEVRDDTLDIEALKSLVIEKGLKLATPQEPVAPMSEEAAPVVVDLEAERIARGGDAVSPDITADNVARQELTRINSETEETEKRIAETLTEMTMLLVTAEEGEGKTTLQGEVVRISETKPRMLAEVEAQEQGDITLKQKLEGRRKLLQNLQQLEMEAVLLRDQIQKALTASSGERGSDSSSPAPTSSTSSTDERPKSKRKGKGSGSGNGGDGEEPSTPPTDDETRAAEDRERLVKMAEADQKELALFLEQAKGPEIVKKIEDILIKRWDDFVNEMKQTAREKKAFIKDKDITFLWRQYVYKDIQDLVVKYIMKNTRLKQYQAKSILRTINQKLKQGDNQTEEE